jgi:exosortase/archaeosortase family protein
VTEAALTSWGGQPRIPSLVRGDLRLPVRTLLLLLTVVIAYHYSLDTLVRGITLQTPLAYLALVPVIAAALGWIRLAREPAPLPVHDRHLDYIVGLGLVALAVAIAVLAPGGMLFWLDRYDLLGLPFFVAGLVALFYGVRRLWALKVPILYLFLAWPIPYAPLVGDGMRAFTTLTSAAVGAVTRWSGTATPSAADPTLYVVGKGAQSFVVSIGSACSGVNGFVGFVLIGGALAYAVRGSLIRRVVWLATGLLLIWLLNAARIEAIFVAGSSWGRDVALQVLHPVAGLATFNLGVVAMLISAEPAGLRFTGLEPRPSGALRLGPPVRRIQVPILIAMNVALLLAIVNAGYARYEPISGDLGQAKLAPFDPRNVAVAGWEYAYVGHFDQATQYFGSDATWQRVLYSSLPTASIRSSVPVYVDAIDTGDAGSLAAYGLDACYQFHGHRIEGMANVDLGPVNAHVVDYRVATDAGSDWSAIWWEWPYRAGTSTRYQRVVVFLTGGPGATFSGTSTATAPTRNDRFAATERFLVALATQLVDSQLARTANP